MDSRIKIVTNLMIRFAKILALPALLLALVLPVGTPVFAQPAAKIPPPIYDSRTLHHPEVSRTGMVVSQHRLASRVGAEILEQGGNAVDAAVATGFALAVVLPRAGNLGGGGFMLVYLAAEDRVIAIDYREMAPAGAGRDMYLDENGEVDQQRVRFSHLSAGVPGTVAGLYHAHSRYGRLLWGDVIRPAIELAAEGAVVSFEMADILSRRRERLGANPATRAALYKAGGVPYEAGEIMRQSDLAWTLDEIARHGPEAFYEGEVADKIIAEMVAGGGIITAEDLAGYRVLERTPVRGTYRGYDIVSMPPPSSGGVHIVQMLNVLENFDLAAMGRGSAATLHVLAETMRRAFADRSVHLGDPDFYDVPMDWLMSKAYAGQIAAEIPLDRALKSDEVAPGQLPVPESPDTTHFSVMDAEGNAVANTYTLNFSFGSGIMVGGAGFLLNNEMDDFSAKAGVPNAFGLLGGEANAIEAAKRPLSSMTPTMVFKDGEPFLITGSPGGSRIITAVLQSIIGTIDFGLNAAEAVHAPRIHHQWYPDVISLEPGFGPETVAALEALGHETRATGAMGSVLQIMYRDGLFYGAADPRRPNALALAPGHLPDPIAGDGEEDETKAVIEVVIEEEVEELVADPPT